MKDGDGRKFPTSRDGTPMYRQGDPQWGPRWLGSSSSLAAAGCAMTATAMAVSKLSGKVINPGEMDADLDKSHGYSGNALIWGSAAKMGGLGAARQARSLSTLNKQNDTGRPVVVGVDHSPGSNGGANGTDHWIAISGVGAKGLMQLMPATAQELGVKDRTDPRQSIEGGTKYLAQQLKRYKGDVRLALAAYNAGAGNVDKYHGVPPFKETQNSVKKITGWYNGAGPA